MQEFVENPMSARVLMMLSIGLVIVGLSGVAEAQGRGRGRGHGNGKAMAMAVLAPLLSFLKSIHHPPRWRRLYSPGDSW